MQISSKQPTGKQPTSQPKNEPCPIIIRFASMFDRDRVLHAYEFQPRKNQRDPANSSSQATWDPAYARVSVRTDLPPKLKKERGRLAAIAYKLRREDKVATRIKLSGSKVLLQTRKNGRDGAPNTAWVTWSEEK